jgi:hypothetical protein
MSSDNLQTRWHPLDYACCLDLDDSSSVNDVATYRSLVGRILCLTTTRPNINFATKQPFASLVTWSTFC